MSINLPGRAALGSIWASFLKGVDFFDDNDEAHCVPHTLLTLGDLVAQDLMSPMSPFSYQSRFQQHIFPALL